MHTCTRSQAGFTDLARIQNFLRSFNFQGGGGRTNPSRSAHADNSLQVQVHFSSSSSTWTWTWTWQFTWFLYYYIYEGKVFHAPLPDYLCYLTSLKLLNLATGDLAITLLITGGGYLMRSPSVLFWSISNFVVFLTLSLSYRTQWKKNYLCKLIANTSESIKVTTFASFWISLLYKNHTCTIFKKGKYNSLPPFNVEWIKLNILIDQICLKDGTQVLMT